VKSIELGKQADIRRGVTARERLSRRAPAIANAPGGTKLLDEPGHLRPRYAGDLLQILAHQAFVGFAQARIAKAT